MVLKEGVQPIEIPFTLVESGLNTYSELKILLPTNIQDGLVFDLDKIEYQMAPSFDPAAAGEVKQEMQLSLTTQSAVIGWDNAVIIAGVIKRAQASAALLHSGTEMYELHVDTRGRANLIGKSSIFLGIDSVNTTVVWRVSGRLIGSLVKLDQKALTQLILNQLK